MLPPGLYNQPDQKKIQHRFGLILILISVYQVTTPLSENDEAMKIAGPAPEHDLIKKLDGKWNVEFKYELGVGMIIEGKGIAEGKMILGGRFLNFEQVTEAAGMKFASLSIMGYDRRINKYTYYGIDEMGTYAVTGEGDYNSSSKILTLNGTTLDPTGKSVAMQDYKFIFEFVNDNEIKCDVVFKMPDNTEKAIVKMTYKR